LQKFQWSAEEQRKEPEQEGEKANKIEQPVPFTIQRRQPSPPLEIVRHAKEPTKVWVDLMLDEDWKGMEVLSTATQRDIEVQARTVFDTAVNIKNFHTPINGIKYYCVVDKLGNQLKEQDRRELQFHGGIPGTTQRREADEAERRKAQDQRWLKEQEMWQPPKVHRAESVPRPEATMSRGNQAPAVEKPQVERKKQDVLESLPQAGTRSEPQTIVPGGEKMTLEQIYALFPTEWSQIWDGEPRDGFRARTRKRRSEWMERFLKILYNGSAAAKSTCAFYIGMVQGKAGIKEEMAQKEAMALEIKAEQERIAREREEARNPENMTDGAIANEIRAFNQKKGNKARLDELKAEEWRRKGEAMRKKNEEAVERERQEQQRREENKMQIREAEERRLLIEREKLREEIEEKLKGYLNGPQSERLIERAKNHPQC
jgi:hypothetical protein